MVCTVVVSRRRTKLHVILQGSLNAVRYRVKIPGLMWSLWLDQLVLSFSCAIMPVFTHLSRLMPCFSRQVARVLCSSRALRTIILKKVGRACYGEAHCKQTGTSYNSSAAEISHIAADSDPQPQQSLSNRCVAVLAVRRDHTPY